MSKSRKPAPIPTREDILEFIKSRQGKVTKRDIARAFGIKGPDKVFLKQILRDLMDKGLLARDTDRALRPSDRLPSVMVIDYAGTDEDGEALAEPSQWRSREAPPLIYLSRNKRRNSPALGTGDRALARLEFAEEATADRPAIYRAHVIKKLEVVKDGILGIFRGGKNGGRIHPIDKKQRDDLLVNAEDCGDINDGELVLADPVKPGRRRKAGPMMAKIREGLGDVMAPKSISLIAIHSHDIPYEFPENVLEAAENAKPVTLGDRTDLRDIPLITIDPADARDHDDAIFAEPDTDPNNQGGWHMIIAIADVSHYVQPGTDLDKEARKRGNSCYFPDRVVPMLPEALSAGLCSLKPGEDRACMAVHIWIDKDGNKRRHKFIRGLMNSHANITYGRVQEALDGKPDDGAKPLLEPVLKPLYGAFNSLMKAHSKRDPLNLDIPEKRIELNDDGQIDRITLRERFDAHKIVEEFMITANVAAAEELEKHRMAAMYRVHDEPTMEKLEALRDFLDTLGMSITKGAVMKPRLFNGILSKVKDAPEEQMVNDIVLRSQTQAYYSPENHGHFGLALARYAHFTSPIRRYADLLVHRGLVAALELGTDGLTKEEQKSFSDTAEHISQTERRAMAAERESTDRYMAAYLSEHVGEEFSGRISGVSKFGLFVSLEPSGGEGLIPISQMGDDFYRLDNSGHRLIGDKTGREFTLGQQLDVRLVEANRYTGGMKLELLGQEKKQARSGKKSRNQKFFKRRRKK